MVSMSFSCCVASRDDRKTSNASFALFALNLRFFGTATAATTALGSPGVPDMAAAGRAWGQLEAKRLLQHRDMHRPTVEVPDDQWRVAGFGEWGVRRGGLEG
eukprot:11196399-Lingulodinium_polyedra.AAC.2